MWPFFLNTEGAPNRAQCAGKECWRPCGPKRKRNDGGGNERGGAPDGTKRICQKCVFVRNRLVLCHRETDPGEAPTDETPYDSKLEGNGRPVAVAGTLEAEDVNSKYLDCESEEGQSREPFVCRLVPSDAQDPKDEGGCFDKIPLPWGTPGGAIEGPKHTCEDRDCLCGEDKGQGLRRKGIAGGSGLCEGKGCEGDDGEFGDPKVGHMGGCQGMGGEHGGEVGGGGGVGCKIDTDKEDDEDASCDGGTVVVPHPPQESP